MNTIKSDWIWWKNKYTWCIFGKICCCLVLPWSKRLWSPWHKDPWSLWIGFAINIMTTFVCTYRINNLCINYSQTENMSKKAMHKFHTHNKNISNYKQKSNKQISKSKQHTNKYKLKHTYHHTMVITVP